MLIPKSPQFNVMCEGDTLHHALYTLHFKEFILLLLLHFVLCMNWYCCMNYCIIYCVYVLIICHLPWDYRCKSAVLRTPAYLHLYFTLMLINMHCPFQVNFK